MEDPAPATPKVTAAELGAYVDADVSADNGFLGECVQEAADLVQDMITRNTGRPVPESVAKRVEKETAADLYHRRSTRNGVATFGAGDDLGGMEAVRVGRDPQATARAMLSSYLLPALA